MSYRPERSVQFVTTVVFVLAALGGVAVERWYARAQLAAAREAVREGISPYAEVVASTLGRRVLQITTLKAFVETAESRSAMERDFHPFSEGLTGSVAGLRAVEIVRTGRISMVSPLRGNEAALGVEFMRHQSEALRRGYQRALTRDQVSIVGPIALAQGGTGLILFLRARAPYDPSIELVELVFDLPSVLQTLNVENPPVGLALELRDRDGEVLVSSHGGALADPVRVSISSFDGSWELRGAPVRGWRGAVAPSLLPIRLALALIVVLATLVTYQVAGYNRRLSRLVDVRTASLQQLAEAQRATIEQQSATERALASSEERLRLALAASHSATYELDVSTGEMRWSEGIGPVVGRPAGTQPDTFEEALTYVDPADRARVTAAFSAGGTAPGQGTLEVRAVREDGGVTWLALTWASRTDDDGVVRRLVGTLTDISERKRLEEQFLHAQKMQALGVLAGGIAHDFNNLLTVIMGAGHMARQGAEVSPKTAALRSNLDMVLGAAERAAVLTGQLLAFSRRQVVQPRRLDLGAHIAGMESMLRRLVGETIRVEASLPASPVFVVADQGQLTQVVMNLAINARDAMPAGGVLRIALRAGGRPPADARTDVTHTASHNAIFSVSDTGTGIDPSLRPRIFEPFFTSKAVGQGTGLGLATVYGIVMQLNGAVRVASELGKGAMFEIYIPIDEEPTAARPEAKAPSVPADGAGRTILLAEDEPDVRSLAERVLGMAGYRLIAAANGAAALEAARAYAGTIDLLVSDVVMPGMSGVELAAALQGERPGLRVLMMSGYPQRVAGEAAVPLDDLPFLAKPFLPSELLAAAESALAER